MPWRVEKRGSRYCVIKEGMSKPVPGGCHATRGDAVKHQRALYAGESRSKASSSRATVTAVLEPAESAKEAAEAMTELAKAGVAVLEEEPTEALAENEDDMVVAEVEEASSDDETDDETKNEVDAPDHEAELKWEGILAMEGMPTDDGRFLIPGEIGEREPMPRPLQVQFETEEQHGHAVTVGGIDVITHIPIADFDKEGFELKDVPDGAIVTWGEGHIENNEDGQRAVMMIENGAGISLDLPPSRRALIDPETLEEVDPEDLGGPEEAMIAAMSGEYLAGYAGNIAAATICTVPAFPAARLRVIPTGNESVLVASAFGQRVIKLTALTAAAAGKAPLKPPREWFETPEADEPTPLTVTPEGRVYGHLALWGQCHTAFAGCEMPNPSRSGYAYFYSGGQIETAEGDLVDIGRITVGKGGNARGGHASIVHGTQGAIEHYDETGCVAAYVTATDGLLGIWLAGTVRSDLPAERIRDLRANPPSLDYRVENGSRELVAVLSVPVPGFPIPRTEMRLVASGVVEEVTAAIVTGFWPEEAEEHAENGDEKLSREELRRRRVLQMNHGTVVEGFEFELESQDFADITSDQRKRWAKSGVALPDGSFPVTKCTGDGPSAVNARRAIGRAPDAKRERVRRHIARREKALGCAKGD